MDPADRAVWAQMWEQLWPEDTAERHASWIAAIYSDGKGWGFIAETQAGEAAGFAEVSVRNFANGCETAPVPFLEGIWVRTDMRRQGIGRGLLRRAESLLVARGFQELGSDALIDNIGSHAAHRAWGFSETERIVYFRKTLTDLPR